MTTSVTTDLLAMSTHRARIARELARASAAGLAPVIVLDAETLVFTGTHAMDVERERRALEPEAVAFAAALVARDAVPTAEQLAGITYVIPAGPDHPAGTFTVRCGALEEEAHRYVRRLRAGFGIRLVGGRPSIRLADTIDALLLRPAAPVRTRAV